MAIRTDLALEAKELWEESAGRTTRLRGVMARESKAGGVDITSVEVLNEEGAQALQKPVGRYVTLELTAFGKKQRDSLERSAEVLASQLQKLMKLKRGQTVLVAGLGNEAVTPDAIGPKVARQLLVTRHLVSEMPALFGSYRPVAAVTPNVLGLTGLESAEVVAGVVDRIRPDCIVAVDALAARDLRRVCTTIQLSDTGIAPGSGVQNARAEFTRRRFGVPVVAVGVPTVADVENLLTDVVGAEEAHSRAEEMSGGRPMIVTPQDIDAQVDRISKLVAWGINLALQENLDVEDLAFFVE